MHPVPSPSPSPSKPQPKRVARSIRLPPDLWAKLDALASAQGVSTNGLLEAMGSRVTGSGVALPASAPGDGTPSAKELSKVTLRIRYEDRAVLSAHASLMGHTVTGYVTAAVRSLIRKAPLMARPETEALLEAVKALGPVGRNLNTVVHRLHREGRWYGNEKLYVDLLASVKLLKARVEGVISQALDRADDL